MSGIAGIISIEGGNGISRGDFNSFFSSVLINRTTESVIENLDDRGFVGVADLSGKIPKVFTSSDGKIKLFVWGEIFIGSKYLENSQDRYEAIMNLWQKSNHTFFQEISGDHVALIFEKKTQKVTLFNSLFGMMPLYYSFQDNRLIFSSRLQSFIDYESSIFPINKNTFLEHLVFNFSIHNNTFLKGVFLLPAASIITIYEGKYKIEKFENHNFLLNDAKIGYNEGTELINNQFKEGIQKLASIESNPACAITGGWDGRLVLSYLTQVVNRDLLLFTYGKETHADMKVAKKLAAKFQFSHLPIMLDDSFVEQYAQLSLESVLLSDGERALNRGHYILMAKKVSEETDVIISGNCGSNILKIVQAPGPVYNEYIFSLFGGNESLAVKASKIYQDFFTKNPWVRQHEFSKDGFIDNILNSEVIEDSNLSSGQRFYHFLLTNVERKYFGAETSAYASYLYNYSPFIDADFIKTIVQTPYYGGHYPFLENNPLVRVQLSKLYAKLMCANHKGLARFTSDRGFPITWFNTPFGRFAGYVKKVLLGKLFYNPDPDGFNHKKGFSQIEKQWEVNPTFFNSRKLPPYGETLSRAFSISQWYKNIYNK